jgi:hypothetical protein
VTFGAGKGISADTAYQFLFWGTFIFAVANGTIDAVINPLIATLFPGDRTHHLNILHASWPAGLVAGGLTGAFLGEHLHWGWKAQLVLFLVPTAFYGLLFLGQRLPKSEASEKGLSLGEMFKDVGILGGFVVSLMPALFFSQTLGLPTSVAFSIGGTLLLAIGIITNFSIGHWMLSVLFVVFALVGAVELGTDQWIQNITGNILTPSQGKILFVLTSAAMFGLRFCAKFVEKNLKMSPIGILFVSAIFGCLGLNLVSGITVFGGALGALLVYGIGKTFFWPTMIAVASDPFPRTGAVAIGIMGGIGMMSAGLIGAPGLGYAKDRFAGEELKQLNAGIFEEYKADKASRFLPFIFAAATGLDGKKPGAVREAPTDQRDARQRTVAAADQLADRHTLRADAFIPATMAVIYLLLLLYFKVIGGYKAVHIEAAGRKTRIIPTLAPVPGAENPAI